MTQTADALKRIRPDEFEFLASAVLRRAEPLYQRLIQTGVNTNGETVRAPLDGICLLPGSNSPAFVIFHHTVDERLRRKWLHVQTPGSKGAKTPDGDAVKAVRWAAEQRKTNPATRVTLVLTYNDRLDPKLIAEVEQYCAPHNVEVDFWEFSRFQDFLDHNRDGQWLRKEYLGIVQERLSSDLLRELSLRSCEVYAKYERLPAGDTWIDRSLDEDLRRRVWDGDKAITFLIAGSGQGKTTATFRLLTRHLAANGLGLWIEPRLLEEHLTIEAAVEATLRSLYPTLEIGSGAHALELSALSGGLLLIVDDVNRSESPSDFVRRVAAWDQQSPLGAAEVGYRALCPVWPQVIDPLLARFRESLEPLCFFGEGFSPAEGVAAIEQRAALTEKPLTKVEATELATALGNDPLLIDLWGEAQTRELKTAGLPIGSLVMENFLQLRVRELPASHLPAEYRETLLNLAGKMLLARRLAPEWREVESWFRGEPDRLSALRQILGDQAICRLGEDASSAQLLFRHDRVRDHLLARAFREWMEEGVVPEDLLAEPYYAEVLGQALATADAEPDWARRAAVQNPLALACALRFFRIPETPFQEAIVESLRGWLEEQVAGGRCIPSLQSAVVWELARTDSSLVSGLSRSFEKPSLNLWRARLRNGDAEAGARLCAQMGVGDHVSWVRSLVRHVADRLGGVFLEDLARLLKQPDLAEDLREGALILAGWLAEPCLGPAIEVAWRQVGEANPDLLDCFVWAAARCSGNGPMAVLGSMIAGWEKLSEEKEQTHVLPPRTEVADHLQRAFTAGPPPDEVVRWLVSQAEKPGMFWPIFVTLKHMNHPEAVAFIAASAAQKDLEAEEAGTTSSASYWSITQHWDSRWSPYPRRLGDECLTRLRSLWEPEGREKHLRRRAFSLWLTQAGKSDLALLQEIGVDSPLYELALTERIWLGDCTATKGVIERLKTSRFPDAEWFRCERIWCPELKTTFDGYLGELAVKVPDGWDFEGIYHRSADVLKKIPRGDAQELLLKHWAHLRRSYVFVQAALRIATPECLKAFDEVMQECPEPERLLQFVHWGIGFRSEEMDEGLSVRHLEALRPYLNLLEENTIEELWWFCDRRHLLSWRDRYLEPCLSPKLRESLGLEDAALMAELDRYAAWNAPWIHLEHWLEEFEKRGDPPDRAKRLLVAWLQERRSPEALHLVGRCLALAGNRAELTLLEAAGLSTGDPRVSEVLEDARFEVFRRTLE